MKADIAELQTLDATVGSEIAGESLLRMPAINRSAMTFFALQPLVIPTRGTISLQAGQHLSGQVAGARADQSTFTVDGVDVTDITSGTNFYSAAATDFNGPTPMIPVPAESVQEFRLSTTNPNATYHQSAGGQLNLITKRGANALHGSGYWYLQNNVLNANRWDYNRAGIARPALHDDRFGASAGGPLIHDKTFFYVNYEGRRLPQSSPVTRLVPTASLKQGILKFVDGTAMEWLVRSVSGSGGFLLGRRTYEMVAAAMTTGAGRCDDTVARRVTPQPGLYGKRVSQIGLITLACLVLGVDRRMRHARIFEVHHGGRRARRARGECWLRGQAGRVVGHGGEAGQRT